jgi:hypothetical protein
MHNDDESDVYYINTDLMLTAPVDLAPLAQAMASAHLCDCSISCLHDSQADDGVYHSVFEAYGPQGSYGTPEESINVLLGAVEQLPQALKPLWQACTRKTMDIGLRSDALTHSLTYPLRFGTLARMHLLGIDLAITVY